MDLSNRSPFKPVSVAKIGLAALSMVLMFNAGFSEAQTSGQKIKVTSQRQVFKPKEGQTQFTGDVNVLMEGTQIKGPQADIKLDDKGEAENAVFKNRPTMTRTSGDNKHTVQAETLDMELKSGNMTATGKVVTNITGSKDGSVTIKSDSQIFDDKKNIMRAIGNVTITKDDIVGSSPEAIIFMKPDDTADKVLFINGAHLVQGDSEMHGQTITVKVDTEDIYAEKNTESIFYEVDKNGNRNKTRVLAHLQEMDNKTGTLIANGNAVIYYADYIAKGPKATFYKKSEKLDKIVLTGRAQVEDPDRRVTGDIVTITMDPRQFNAQGNVTTFIKAKNENAQTAKKPGNTSAQPVATATPDDNPPSAYDQEQIIEDATGGSGNPL